MDVGRTECRSATGSVGGSLIDYLPLNGYPPRAPRISAARGAGGETSVLSPGPVTVRHRRAARPAAGGRRGRRRCSPRPACPAGPRWKCLRTTRTRRCLRAANPAPPGPVRVPRPVRRRCNPPAGSQGDHGGQGCGPAAGTAGIPRPAPRPMSGEHGRFWPRPTPATRPGWPPNHVCRRSGPRRVLPSPPCAARPGLAGNRPGRFTDRGRTGSLEHVDDSSPPPVTQTPRTTFVDAGVGRSPDRSKWLSRDYDRLCHVRDVLSPFVQLMRLCVSGPHRARSYEMLGRPAMEGRQDFPRAITADAAGHATCGGRHDRCAAPAAIHADVGPAAPRPARIERSPAPSCAWSPAGSISVYRHWCRNGMSTEPSRRSSRHRQHADLVSTDLDDEECTDG